MSGLFGGGGGSKKSKKEGYIPPAGQPPQAEADTNFPAPGAIPVPRPNPTPASPIVGGFDDVGMGGPSSSSWG